MRHALALLGQARLAVGSDTIRLLGGITAFGFVATATLPPAYHLSAICGRVDATDIPDLLAAGLFVPSISTLAVGWTAMILAMMPLLLAGPAAHVRRCTLPRRRFRAILIFGLSYGMCWIVAGGVLIPMALLLGLVLGLWTAASLTLATALCWSASPLAQGARNACHRRRRIGAFGPAADLDCVRQGVTTGTACVGTCWPWMLLPALAGDAHLAAMAAVTVVVTTDRFAAPASLCWRVPPLFRPIAISYRRRRDRLRTFPAQLA